MTTAKVGQAGTPPLVIDESPTTVCVIIFAILHPPASFIGWRLVAGTPNLPAAPGRPLLLAASHVAATHQLDKSGHLSLASDSRARKTRAQTFWYSTVGGTVRRRVRTFHQPHPLWLMAGARGACAIATPCSATAMPGCIWKHFSYDRRLLCLHTVTTVSFNTCRFPPILPSKLLRSRTLGL